MSRDILVLSRRSYLSKESIEQEMAQINQIVYLIENWGSFCAANEVLDLNKRKVIQKPHLIKSYVTDKLHHSFVFVVNKN